METNTKRSDRQACDASIVAEVLSVFRDLHTAYSLQGDTWRARAFKNAERAFSDGCLSTRGRLGSDPEFPLESIPGIGKGVAHVIRTVIEQQDTMTHEALLQELLLVHNNNNKASSLSLSSDLMTKLAAYKSFSNLLGVGTKKAVELVRAGYTCSDQLKSPVVRARHGLDRPLVVVGLQYERELSRRVPRRDATCVIHRLQRVLRSLSLSESNNMTGPYDFIPLGSYRRGASSVGDIDLLLTDDATCKDTTRERDEDVLSTFGEACRVHLQDDFVHLISKGARRLSFLMKYQLSSSKGNDCRLTSDKGRGKKGVCQVDVFRMQDANEEASFLLYGTGNALFNEGMRQFAKSKGFKLNEYGLFDFSKGGGRRIEGVACEADIFSVLGLPFVDPKKRHRFIPPFPHHL